MTGISFYGGRALALVASLIVGGVVGPASATAASAQAQAQVSPPQANAKAGVAAVKAPGDLARLIQIPGGRKLYLECRGSGRPTVILVSGLGNAADVWSFRNPGVKGPAVLPGLARHTRVCAYDRPNTTTVDEKPGRSDPVRQPQGARRAVSDLHALLHTADIPGPYVLAGHSYGGLIARLYASTYPHQVAGMVLVDATYELFRELFTPEQWAALARVSLEPPPGFDPPLELFDINRSYDQMLRAKVTRPLRATLPLVVLSRGLAQDIPPDLALPPLPDPATVERAWRTAQDWLGGILPNARHVIARRSSHYIQTAQPELVIDSVRRVLRMLRPATVRCRGGGGSCRARVSLAGGASNKRVVVRLADTDLRLVSARPNRSSLRGEYGLSANRLRAGGSEYVFRLDAAQSIPNGSDLLLEFRAAGD